MPIDPTAVERVLALPYVVVNDAAHAREHSLEVHVPFLQEVLGDFQVVPLAVGEVTSEEVSAVIELLWGGEETLLVVSSDLSHFHDYETAVRVDTETSHLIESLRFEDLTGERCCGFRPISGMLEAARHRGLRVRMLDLRNSGDTAGPRDRVVGYGAFVLEDAKTELAGPSTARFCSTSPTTSIAGALEEGHEIPIAPEDYPERLQMLQASFVTLHVAGTVARLHGFARSDRALVVNVARNAYAAAFRDPRFGRLTRDEFPRLEIHLSLLSRPEELYVESEADLLAQMRPGIDGLTLIEGGRRGTLLPSVWKSVGDAREFLIHLKHKTGLAAELLVRHDPRRALHGGVDRPGPGVIPLLEPGHQLPDEGETLGRGRVEIGFGPTAAQGRTHLVCDVAVKSALAEPGKECGEVDKAVAEWDGASPGRG